MTLTIIHFVLFVVFLIIDAAYPFNQRSHWPYKAWLKARKTYLRDYGYGDHTRASARVVMKECTCGVHSLSPHKPDCALNGGRGSAPEK